MTFTNPWVPLGDPYQPVENYITISEYQTAATAVDTASLAPSMGTADNNAVLLNKIAIASRWADLICMQTLAATVNSETSQGPLYIHSDGTVHVNVKYWPVLEVDSFQAGWQPSLLAAISNPQDMWMLGRSTIVVPLWGLSPPVGPGYFPALHAGDRVFCQWTYVNGWPNATLTATVNANATTLPLSNTLGFYVGRTYKIFDIASGNPETFTCTSVPAGSAASRINPGSIGCTALAATHTAPGAPDGIGVSGMPDSIRQAVVHLVSQSIKSRGAESIALASFGGTQKMKTMASEEGFEDLANAMDLLDYYARVA